MINKESFKIFKPNRLPAHQEENTKAVGLGRFPSYLHRKLPKGPQLSFTNQAMRQARLHTVCEEAKCPNLFECWSKKTATYLILGKECTRACGFCSIEHSKTPKPIEEDEPERVANSAAILGLKHIVITMVARDDLSDGGSQHLVNTIKAVRTKLPETKIEVLTSDFDGNWEALKLVIEALPDVYNYNIETVRRLTPRVRHKATYERTLELLSRVKQDGRIPHVKSGLMVGLGETEEEVKETLRDLQKAGCNLITIGQYLQPGPQKLLVKEFITPEQFEKYAAYGKTLGLQVFAGPFVRSSYRAGEFAI